MNDEKIEKKNGEPWTTKRIWFCKTGKVIYISHLDVNRCITRAVHRANVPLWYTEGFNPHPYLTFALPLPLGIEGQKESFDLRLLEEVPEAELLCKINQSLPEGLQVTAVTEPKDKPSAIAYGVYQVALLPQSATATELASKWEQFLAQPEILVEKKTKKGTKQLDILPMVQQLAHSTTADAFHLTLSLPAGNVNNLNPFLLLSAFSRFCTLDYTPRLTRTQLLTAEGEAFV